MPRVIEPQRNGRATPLPTIQQATISYEAWLEQRIPTVKKDFATKHDLMRQSAFACLRGTFYHFMQHWPRTCTDLNDAPQVLAVGDLHLENYGSWRDAEGRLAWGVNDFDEACNLPYTIDLVRLCTSARLAIAEERIAISSRAACKNVLAGYRDCLSAGGRGFVLEADHDWLRALSMAATPGPMAFWRKLEALPTVPRKHCAAPALDAMRSALPDINLEYRVVKRVAGLGSLGRARLVALADWRGGRVAREVKPLCISAVLWAQNSQSTSAVQYQHIVERAVRSNDPSLRVHGDWLVHRLAPDAARINLSSAKKLHCEAKLLYAMGWEAANVHLGSGDAVTAVQRDLEQRPANWLEVASKAMAALAVADWRAWKRATY